MKNRAASIRARLLNLAKKENLDFQLIIIRFLHERLLYRLSKSGFSDHFILKGGAFIYAMIELSQANSRMKDFYDLYVLLTTTNPDFEMLRLAIIATFNNRKTMFVDNHSLFTKEFTTDFQRTRNWEAFLKKIDRKNSPSFEAVMQIITNTIKPIWENLNSTE